MKKLTIILFLFLFSFSNAFASWQFALAGSYLKRTASYTINSSEVEYDETRTPMQFKLGTVLRNKVYLGGIYDMGTRTLSSGGVTTKPKDHRLWNDFRI